MTRVASFTNVLAIITAVACGALLAAGSRSTNAATTSLLATVNHQSGDRFYNYDFTRNDLERARTTWIGAWTSFSGTSRTLAR